MNPVWLGRNLHEAWGHRAGVRDFVKRMLWLYDRKPRFGSTRGHYEIGFRYPSPVGGIRLAVRPNLGSDAFIFGEVFHHEYYRMDLRDDPHTILDLGANAGFTAVYFGRKYSGARLACVEPMPANVRILERNLALNAICAEVLPVAAAVNDGSVFMEVTAKDYGHRIIASPTVGDAIEVPALSIDTIRRRVGWDRIGLLKIDIEGYEKTLLAENCSWLWQVDNLCIECHEGFGEADLRRIARQFGFLAPSQLPGIWLLRRN